MVFSALALAQSEVIWYFQHVGIASSRSKTARMVPVDIDPSDPTIVFLLDGMDRLCCLVRKYIAAIRGYALSYLSSCAGRIRFLLGTPGMVALDLDGSLKGLLQQIVHHLENIPKLQGENTSAITCDLSEFRKDWLSILMIVTSARSSINIRHLEKATVSTGKEGLLSEGNAAYIWSRSHLVAKLIFLDQLSEISPYLPRSSLEAHIPYAILRSVYSQYYSNSPSMPLALLSASPRHSPAVSLHASPVVKQPRGDSTPQYGANDSAYFKGTSSHSQEHPYDIDSANFRSTENKHRNVRRSGPLDYSSSRKVKINEGSTSGITGPSPLPRSAVSRSGPLLHK